MHELNKILKLLLQNRVEFILVGGLAAVTYGASTMTQDVDVCFSFHAENVEAILRALRRIHPRVRAGSGIVSLYEYTVERLCRLRNLYLKTDWGELDLLGEIKGVGNFEEVKKTSIEVTLFDHACRILSIDSLIQSKQAMNRPKDKQVVLELKVLRRKKR